MFSVSETTLATLKMMAEKLGDKPIELYAIVPYAYEYVRLATQLGVVGLVKKLGKKIVLLGNSGAIFNGLKGILRVDPECLMKTYLLYELSRIKSSAGKQMNIASLMLHEVVTDMLLSMNADWLVKSYINFLSKRKIKPGFETRNFEYLVNKFKEWNIDFSKIVIAAPFNKVGFQMVPSKEKCEKTLAEIPESTIIAFSILAAGYLKLDEAVDYMKTLPNLKGVAVGVSKEHQSRETFKFLHKKF
ncbi:MAG: hypothetical protein JXA91_08170 [Candidatus Thermoplasmatota archaeon]|nr:hypothetical protein [Candidatus Thermoplasmatota archaeon]